MPDRDGTFAPGPRRADAAGRRHHIASVAHHFLGGDPAADAPAVAVVVAAAVPLPVTAFVAASAARTGAIRSGATWGLLEDAGAPWPVRTHLAGDERVRPLVAGGFQRRDGSGRGLCWHLGPATGDRLDAWSTACRLPGCALPTEGRRVHLLWCVPAETAAALAPLGSLARLAALLGPAMVDLVVAPRGWPHRPTAGAAPGSRALARLRSRAGGLCGCSVGVGVGVVGPGMGTAAAAALVTDLLHAAATADGS